MVIEHWKPKKTEYRTINDPNDTGGIASCRQGVSGDDKAVKTTIPCFEFEKKKYSNNMVEQVPSIINKYTKIFYIFQ